jgi:hypothetical protein
LFAAEEITVFANLGFLTEMNFNQACLLDCAAEVLDSLQVEVVISDWSASAFEAFLIYTKPP